MTLFTGQLQRLTCPAFFGDLVALGIAKKGVRFTSEYLRWRISSCFDLISAEPQ